MTSHKRNISEAKSAIIILFLFATTLGAMLLFKIYSVPSTASRKLLERGRSAVITMGFVTLPFSRQNKKASTGSAAQRAQSAMEYLMTYGWAILIIAVVLAALFSLGVFNKGALLGASCVGSPGYLCQAPLLSSAGAVQFQFGQSTGSPVYNALFACVSTSDSNTIQLPTIAAGSNGNIIFNAITTAGAVTPGLGSITVASGQQFTISGLECYGQGGVPVSSGIGQSFTGIIWMAYNPTTTGAAVTQIVKVGTFSARASS